MSEEQSMESARAGGPGLIGKVRAAWPHLHGYVLLLVLRGRYRSLTRDARPLALHLEREVFPALRERGEKWLSLFIDEEGGPSRLRGASGRAAFEFPGTEPLAGHLRAVGVERLRLDTSLEYGQMVEALLILRHVAREFPSATPGAEEYTGWDAAAIAAAMLGERGYRKVCANMRFDPALRQYEVEYTYCELLFSRVVRNYVERAPNLRDHRALFRLAPYAALCVILLFALADVVLIRSVLVGAVLYIFLAFLAAAAAWLGIHVIGSMQYTQEHHERLIRSYYHQAMVLSRFPMTNPNPVMKLAPDGQPLYLNPATEELLKALGLAKGAVAGLLPDDYRDLVDHCLNEDVAKHTAEASRHGRVFRYTFSPFPDERAVIVAGSDVTYLKEIENELRVLNTQLESLVEARTTELQETQDVTILSLAGLAEIRDKETGEHLQRTRLYVRTLAERLRHHPGYEGYLSDAMIDRLYKSAPLHDIGKVGVRDAILLKPGALTPEELGEMRQHTTKGGDALHWAEKKLGFDSFLSVAREIAYAHHEKWDGTGYPNGLKGEEIPRSARLMSLADVYDALTTRRVYKDAYPHARARQLITEWRGKTFDPAVVDAFLACEDDFIRIAEVYRDPEPVEQRA